MDATVPTPSDLVESMPFAAALGITLDHARAEEVQGRLSWAADRCTIGGALHGGALMSLADSVAAICAYLNLPDGAMTSTIESKTNFFRAARAGDVIAAAHPIHVGRRTIVVQTDIRDDAGARVALVTQTQAVIEPRSS
jgi:uncharacterized protein (TIGR00369 family)